MNIALVAANGCRGLGTSLALQRTLARTRANFSATVCGNYFAARRSLSSKSSAFPCESSVTDVAVTQTATTFAENG